MLQLSVSPQASALLLTVRSVRPNGPTREGVAAPVEAAAAVVETVWRVPYWVVLLSLWALFVVPSISLHAVVYEEQTVIGLARGALEDGHWVAPHLYGVRFVERPVLMSWIIALLSWPFGAIHVPIARVPTVLSALAGAMLILRLVGRTESTAAGFYAAVCFLTAPVLLPKIVVAEPDLMLAVMLFGAFVLWWEGASAGKVSIGRWSAVGLILAVAGLIKGPQPLAYFFIGVFAFLVLARRWNEVVGLAFAGVIASVPLGVWYLAVYQTGDVGEWISHSRIGSPRALGDQVWNSLDFLVRVALGMLPATVLPPLLVRRDREDSIGRLWLALLLYATCCTAILLFWPGARARYAMPALPALASLTGILFARMRLKHPLPFRISDTLIAVLIGYQLILGWLVTPNFPGLFAQARTVGDRIASVMRADPAPLYPLRDALDLSPLIYVPGPVRAITFAELADVQLPAWAIVTPKQVAELQARRPDLEAEVRLLMPEYQDARLVYVRKRRQ